ncbi:MAG: ABC transporter permease [Clostridiales bacterium]|nr:ABC transporter permease [Clostridiales bacterium]
MKFMTLLKKELREMLTVGTVLSLLVGVVLLAVIGNVMSSATEEGLESAGSVNLIDEDDSELSRQSIEMLREMGFEVNLAQRTENTGTPADYKPQDDQGLLVIPAGFEEKLQNGEQAAIQSYSTFQSLGLMSMISSSGTASAVELINEVVSSQLMGTSSDLDLADNIAFYKNPVTLEETTFVGGQYTDISPDILMSYSMSQSMVIPLVIFILVIFASQMISGAIANEKGDKTLETLLCAPVSRLTVLFAKICGAGIVSLLMAGVYMIGFSGYMNGLMGSGEVAESLQETLTELGVTMAAGDYVLLGVQLFLTILGALALSIILGAMSQDVKQAQAMVMPLMIMMLVPYMVTMFMDIGTLSLPFQILLYLIPFTHTFTASSNLIFGNYTMYAIGVAYQLVFLIITMTVAVRIFSSDKIFTMKLNFGQKSRRKSAPQA